MLSLIKWPDIPGSKGTGIEAAAQQSGVTVVAGVRGVQPFVTSGAGMLPFQRGADAPSLQRCGKRRSVGDVKDQRGDAAKRW